MLARVFGEVDALFSREDEQRIFAAVARAGLGPRLLVRHFVQALSSARNTFAYDHGHCKARPSVPGRQASFRNGRVEEFLLDQSISAAEMRKAPVALCVAAAMACFHFSELTAMTASRAGAPLSAIVWPRLRTWARAVAGLYSPAELSELGLTSVLQQARRKQVMSAHHRPSSFS